MTEFGQIQSYDSGNGMGTITPEKGGEALPFSKSDMRQQSQEPQQNQRFGYDVKDADTGKRYAVNLQPQPNQGDVRKEQARAQQG